MTEGANISIDTNMKLVRFQFIIRYLGCRGDSYENHHKELVLQTFQPHDAFLEENYGFSTNEIIEFIDNILAEVKNNLKPYKKP